jgi:hypothetical protein
VLEKERGKGGLQERGKDVAVLRQPLELVGRDVGASFEQARAEAELTRDDCAARA